MNYAFQSLQAFKPTSIEEMSLVTACIRPSGASYRDELLARKPHHNPSEIIDLLLENNLGYCIEENQEVQTTDGCIAIKDIREGMDVVTRTGTHRVLRKTYMGKKSVVEVVHASGKLICTPDHKILTDEGYKRADELSTDDSVAIRLNTASVREYDPNILRIVGWLLGDGVLSTRRNISLVNKDMDVHKEFRACVEGFDKSLTTSICDRTTPAGTALYRSNVKFVNNSKSEKSLRIKLRELGLIGSDGVGHTAVSKRVPPIVFALGADSIKTVIGAYTDTDSCVHNRVPVLKYTTASEGLANDIQLALRLIGFSTTIYRQTEKAFVVTVRDAKGALRVLRPYSIKIQKVYSSIDSLNETRSSGGGQIKRDRIRNIVVENGVNMKRLYNKTGVNLYTNAQYILASSVKRISGFVKDDRINMICDGNISWSPVSYVKDMGESRDVYDLTVESEHNFVCNGVVVHNCIYQEDIISFLQKICGLSGSEADTVRRGIARKKPEILEKALPRIIDGYCSMSASPRDVAEKECGEFLQIIEDASSYMFG